MPSPIVACALIASLLLPATARSAPEPERAKAHPTSAGARVTRVASRDGTLIAVECAGSGPTVVMVHGGTGDRTRWSPMLPLLASRFTACAMDRRGRGDSGDGPGYSLQKEAEDVAAVVDAQRGTTYVLGHSFGAVTALEATFVTRRIAKLILYEPPLKDPATENVAAADRIEQLVREGRREEALEHFLLEVVRQTPGEITAMRSRPSWPKLLATIDSQPRQIRALAAYRFDPARIARVTVPTLLLMGSDTASPYLRSAVAELGRVLPRATTVLLEGQSHNAVDAGRDELARAITAFLVAGEDPEPAR